MKDMLTEQDIKRIGVEVASVIEHNINPQFEGVYQRLDKIEGRLDGVEDRLDGVESRLGGVEGRLGMVETRLDTEMVTKHYLDDKMADLKGDLIAQDRKLEKKTDTLIETLVERRALTASDVEHLEQTRVFPRHP